MFNAIGTAGTGLSTYRTWIDVIANNIANVNTTTRTDEKAFQAQYVRAQEIGGGMDGVGQGVEVTELPLSSPEGRMSYEPDSPLADANGYVRRPDIDMSEQMGNLIMAQRAFQANANVVDRAKEVYQAAINIGKGI
jgi:flagellar basal-body rod protein FlgC